LPDFRDAIKPRGTRREMGLRLEAAAQVGLGRSRVEMTAQADQEECMFVRGSRSVAYGAVMGLMHILAPAVI
jgi:biopolymer transport protein ExbD